MIDGVGGSLYFVVTLPNTDEIVCKPDELVVFLETIIDEEEPGYRIPVRGLYMTEEEYEDVGEY